MIFKRTSLLLRCLNKNASLFDKWKKRYLNDGSIEEIIYEKDNIRIIFQKKHIATKKSRIFYTFVKNFTA